MLRRPRLSDSPPWPDGVARHVLASLDSTNAHAMRLAASSGPAWFLALEQTAGKGRRARAWASPRGNFHATLLIHPPGPAAQVALRSFVAAVALREALVTLTGLPAAFSLKWPNDVLLNGGKVAGILLESVASATGVAHLAIGIGVNLIAAPDQALLDPGALPAVNLRAQTGVLISPERLLDQLATTYAHWESVFTSQGFFSTPFEFHLLSGALPLRAQPQLRAHTTLLYNEGKHLPRQLRLQIKSATYVY